jgi:arylsulfatase A-like enzyme
MTALDLQVGRSREKLEELGVAENTILFYTSDNGPEGKTVKDRTQGQTKGLKARKRSLNEEWNPCAGYCRMEGDNSS